MVGKFACICALIGCAVSSISADAQLSSIGDQGATIRVASKVRGLSQVFGEDCFAVLKQPWQIDPGRGHHIVICMQGATVPLFAPFKDMMLGIGRISVISRPRYEEDLSWLSRFDDRGWRNYLY